MRNRLTSSQDFNGQLEKSTTASIGLDEPSFMDEQVCLFGPERYEPRYDYPLVVWLHSTGSGEREIENVMPELSLQNFVACAPRGPIACDPAGRTFRWSDSPAASAISEEVIFEAISVAQSEFSIASNRIFLAGFGSGGSMAWRLALRYPKRFAGVVSICGAFPQENRPLKNYSEARDLPTLWMYGAESTSCGIDKVCESLPVMHSASLSVDIRQYPCGDQLLTNMLSDANNWIMQRVTNQPTCSVESTEENFSRN
ncbi:MAG: phospholipase [Aureliella sp.]